MPQTRYVSLHKRIRWAAAQQAPPAAPGTFSPTDVGFSHVYWTGGTEFQALGLSDTDAVSSWPDEVGTADLVQATGSAQPTLDTDGLSSQPTVKLDGTDDVLKTASAATVTDPWTIVMVVQDDDADTNQRRIWHNLTGSDPSAFRTPTWQWDPNLGFNTGVNNDGNPHLHVWLGSDNANGNWWDLDGVRISDLGEATGIAGNLSALTLGAYSGSPDTLFWDGDYAFIGIYEGDATVDPNWFNFLDWVYDTYAIDARPPSLVDWSHLFWTEGADFATKGYADTDAVSNWPDEIGAEDLAQATGTQQPTLDADGLGGNAQLVFDGTDDWIWRSRGNWTSVGQPDSVITVMQYLSYSPTAEDVFMDGELNGVNNHIVSLSNSSDTPRMYAGTNVYGTRSGDTNPHLVLTYWNGAASEMEIDGDLEISGNAGSHTLDGLLLGRQLNPAGYSNVGISFWANFDGDVRTDPYWEQAESYLRWKYGLFDPVADVAWSHAYWTEGTEFTALGLSDTDAVSSWPDEVGTLDVSQGTGTAQPTYAASSGPNSQPTVTFDGGDLMSNASLSLTAPVSIVIVTANNTGTTEFFVGTDDSAIGVRHKVSPDGYGMFVSTQFNSGVVADGLGNLVTAVFDTTDTLIVDGTKATGAIAGATFDHLTVGAQRTTSPQNYLTGDIAFLGVFDGDVTADPGWPFFLQWVEQHYGITQFDPVNDVGWSHAYWTEGAEFLAQGYADTNAVDTWPDEVGTADLAQATGTKQPSYDVSGGDIAQPSVLSDATDDFMQGAFGATYPSGTLNSIVVVHDPVTTPGSGNVIFDGDDSTNRQQLYFSTSTYYWYSGTVRNTSKAHDTNPHLHVAVFNTGGTDVWERDNAAFDSATTGSNSIDGLSIFNDNAEAGNAFAQHLHFIAIFDGDVRTDPNWQRWLAWAREHYGLPVAIG